MSGLAGNEGVISYDCRCMQVRHLLAALAVGSLTALVGCSTGGSATPAPSSSTSVSGPSVSVSEGRPAGLHEKWSAKFEDLSKGDDGAKCTEARPKSQTCVDHLTQVVTLVIDLRSEITARPDAASYTDTLAQIEKVTDASNTYAKCTAGCYEDALVIGLAPVTLMLQLQLEDPTRR